jgi:hypothetical protein
MVPLVQWRRPRIATFATSLNNRSATVSTMGQKGQLTDTAAHEFEN